MEFFIVAFLLTVLERITSMKEILKLMPSFKDYIWGGNKLKTIYNKQTNISPLAESWELSAHKDGQSTIIGGEYDGKTLSEYIRLAGKEVLGENCSKFEFFPMLIKFIDAKQPLSVQVHPDDNYALKNENSYGKTEMWYVIDCEEGAYLYFGVNKNLSKQEFEDRINSNTITEALNKVEVKKGDVFFIEAGTIHAIGAGILICEVQQNSNLTYRVYDYDRKDANGNGRELHIEKAIEVSTLSPTIKQEFKSNKLCECEYFSCDKYIITDSLKQTADTASFVSLTVLSGAGVVENNYSSTSFCAGDSLFIPANSGEFTIKGECEVLKTTV